MQLCRWSSRISRPTLFRAERSAGMKGHTGFGAWFRLYNSEQIVEAGIKESKQALPV